MFLKKEQGIFHVLQQITGELLAIQDISFGGAFK
jgi:hypothetical protein